MAISTELTAFGSALVGAVIGGGFTVVLHRRDSYTQHVQKTRDALLQLTDLRGQIMDCHGVPLERMEVLFQKRAMLLSVAESFAARAGGALSAHDWIALGGECRANRDFKDALDHLERAVRCSDSEDLLTRVIARRVLGAYRYERGRFRDPAQGARLFREAVELTRPDEDSYLLYNTGLSLAMWAWWAADNKEPSGEQLLAEAKQCYAKAIDGYPQAREALEGLEQRSQQQATVGDSPPPVDLPGGPA